MPLVRRARKSIQERKSAAQLRELQQNLEKVETRVHMFNQKKRTEKRKMTNTVKTPVPTSVIDGKMNPELYAVECRLHSEAGLPPPRPYAGYDPKKVAPRRLGFVNFSTIVKLVRLAAAEEDEEKTIASSTKGRSCTGPTCCGTCH
eukprot:GDKK01013694.1.p1 GENE.GDKK01013694.1~~GDKK01013694.1.p1  ORF type:complete len:146 (+),score=9.10 GDKK01013694.1:74-511(+)